MNEENRGRFSSFSAAREAIVGIALALILEVGNRLIAGEGESTTPGTVLAISVAIVGILLALQRYGLQEGMNAKFAEVDRMAGILDLSEEANTHDPVRGLLHAYLRITEPEFRDLKDQVVVDSIQTLTELENSKRSATLASLEYYQWLFGAFDGLKKGEYMHAVSLSSDTEWNESELERKFLDKNLSAAANGASISRIFIAPRGQMPEFIKRAPIAAHCSEVKNGLEGYFVDREELENAERRFLESVGEGFIDFNGHVGLEDIFDENGAVRGQVTLNPSDLTRMKNIYDRLLTLAVPLTAKSFETR